MDTPKPVLAPVYGCGVCHDTGWLRRFVGPEEWKHELVRCDCQREADAARAYERARAASDLDGWQLECDFAGYDATYNAAARDALASWAADLGQSSNHPSGAPWVVLTGGYGTGKSHLLAAAFNQRGRTGGHPIYAVVPLLLDHIRAGIADGEYGERFDAVMKCPELLLDDLGAEKRTDWSDEALFKLLDWRYRRRLPTVVASNLDPDDLERRISSRLQDTRLSSVIAMGGPDMRKVSVKARAAR